MTETTARILTEAAAALSSVPRYELMEWRREFGVVAGITGRQRGFDLMLAPDAPAASVGRRWQDLLNGLGRDFDAVVVSHQDHRTAVGVYQDRVSGLVIQTGLDGHVTAQAGLIVAITVADCVPIYLLHPPSRAMALLHAGWRGTAGGILDAGVENLCELAGGPPRELVMHCGVSICGSCYQVGPEVVEAVRGRRPEGPQQLDLREILIERAQELGVRQLTVSPWCTSHDRDQFYSHRASGGRDSRMAAYLGRPAA